MTSPIQANTTIDFSSYLSQVKKEHSRQEEAAKKVNQVVIYAILGLGLVLAGAAFIPSVFVVCAVYGAIVTLATIAAIFRKHIRYNYCLWFEKPQEEQLSLCKKNTAFIHTLENQFLQQSSTSLQDLSNIQPDPSKNKLQQPSSCLTDPLQYTVQDNKVIYVHSIDFESKMSLEETLQDQCKEAYTHQTQLLTHCFCQALKSSDESRYYELFHAAIQAGKLYPHTHIIAQFGEFAPYERFEYPYLARKKNIPLFIPYEANIGPLHCNVSIENIQEVFSKVFAPPGANAA